MLAVWVAAPDADTLAASLSQLQGWAQDRPLAAPLIFAGVYVAAAALSIPIATALSLTAGALFGLLTGTLVVITAASIGATLAMLAARYLWRDAVKAWLTRRGWRQPDIDGAAFLSLRLFPAAPFFVTNLAMGLTHMPVRQFFPISVVGMLPATAITVNVGAQLGRVDSLRDAFSPAVILSLTALAALPLLGRWVVKRAPGRNS